jgi:hypothetical protein
MIANSTSDELRRAAEPLQTLIVTVEETIRAVHALLNAVDRVHGAFTTCVTAYSTGNPVHGCLKEFSRVLSKLHEQGDRRSGRASEDDCPPSVPTFERFVNVDCLEPLHMAVTQIKAAARAKAELVSAIESHASTKAVMEAKAAKYAEKGRSLAESSKFSELKASEAESRHSTRRLQNAFDTQLTDARVAKETAIVRSLRGFGEHMSGVTGVLSAAMNCIFASAPTLSPQSQRTSRPASPQVGRRSPSGPALSAVSAPVYVQPSSPFSVHLPPAHQIVPQHPQAQRQLSQSYRSEGAAVASPSQGVHPTVFTPTLQTMQRTTSGRIIYSPEEAAYGASASIAARHGVDYAARGEPVDDSAYGTPSFLRPQPHRASTSVGRSPPGPSFLTRTL